MQSGSSHDKVLVVESLNQEALTQLFNNTICVLRVPQYCATTVCEQLSTWFLNNEAITPYHYVMKQEQEVKSIYFGVDRVGSPFNSTYGDEKEKDKYYAAALLGISALRKASVPFLSPIDRLRLELDENWVQGANLASFENKKMFIGIGRVMKSELSHLSELQPHWDSVPTQYVDLQGQFSANIYLSTPNVGGELEIWDVEPLPTSIIHKNDVNRDWRAELPPSISVKPETGDLLIFNTRRPHAIKCFDSGTRIATQFFIGINQNQSLAMWV
jgi:hypothetical protein